MRIQEKSNSNSLVAKSWDCSQILFLFMLKFQEILSFLSKSNRSRLPFNPSNFSLHASHDESFIPIGHQATPSISVVCLNYFSFVHQVSWRSESERSVFCKSCSHRINRCWLVLIFRLVKIIAFHFKVLSISCYDLVA